MGQELPLLRDRLFEALWHPDEVGSDADRREALVDGGIARYDHEVRFLGPEGEAIPCLATFRLAELRSGGAAGIVVGVQDLRERRRAEAEREMLIREQAGREQAERLADRLAAMQRITDVSLRASSFEPLVEDLLLRTAEVLGADSAAIVLDAEERVYQLAPGMVVESLHASGETPLGEAAAVCSALLDGDGGQFGSLLVGSIFPRKFTGTDEAMLRLAADRAGQAITRVRLFEREHAIRHATTRTTSADGSGTRPGRRNGRGVSRSPAPGDPSRVRRGNPCASLRAGHPALPDHGDWKASRAAKPMSRIPVACSIRARTRGRRSTLPNWSTVITYRLNHNR